MWDRGRELENVRKGVGRRPKKGFPEHPAVVLLNKSNRGSYDVRHRIGKKKLNGRQLGLGGRE